MAIYQAFQAKISALGGQLRDWNPSYDGSDLALTFGNRYLTKENEKGLDQVVDISKHVDPFHVLSPLLRLEVHTTDNVMINEERIIVFYERAIPAICVTQNATQLGSQKGASKHSH